MALKIVDVVDENLFDNEISSTEIAYLAKQFRNILKNNNKKARNKNFVDHKNVKKIEQPKNDFTKKSNSRKEKLVHLLTILYINNVLVVKAMDI